MLTDVMDKAFSEGRENDFEYVDSMLGDVYQQYIGDPNMEEAWRRYWEDFLSGDDEDMNEYFQDAWDFYEINPAARAARAMRNRLMMKEAMSWQRYVPTLDGGEWDAVPMPYPYSAYVWDCEQGRCICISQDFIDDTGKWIWVEYPFSVENVIEQMPEAVEDYIFNLTGNAPDSDYDYRKYRHEIGFGMAESAWRSVADWWNSSLKNRHSNVSEKNMMSRRRGNMLWQRKTAYIEDIEDWVDEPDGSWTYEGYDFNAYIIPEKSGEYEFNVEVWFDLQGNDYSRVMTQRVSGAFEDAVFVASDIVEELFDSGVVKGGSRVACRSYYRDVESSGRIAMPWHKDAPAFYEDAGEWEHFDFGDGYNEWYVWDCGQLRCIVLAHDETVTGWAWVEYLDGYDNVVMEVGKAPFEDVEGILDWPDVGHYEEGFRSGKEAWDAFADWWSDNRHTASPRRSMARVKSSRRKRSSWSDFDSPIADEMNELYLPSYGEGETMASQIATAVNKLVYKWFNDGDVFDNVHTGLEGWANDLSSYANWLYTYVNFAKMELSPALGELSENEYESMLHDLFMVTLCDENLMENYSEQPAVGSVYNCSGPFEWDDSYGEDEDDWYDDDEDY